MLVSRLACNKLNLKSDVVSAVRNVIHNLIINWSNEFLQFADMSTMNRIDTDNVFTRELELESREVALTLYQKVVGDVSCVVWDAALVLAKYLDFSCRNDKFGKDWLRGKKVLELGSGLGCVGMTAACLGADVLMTDLAETLPMLKKNNEMNKRHWKSSGGSTEVQAFSWGQDAVLNFKPDIILFADCVYYAESIEPLLDTLENLCGNEKRTYALLSQEVRDTPGQIPVWQNFMTLLKRRFNIHPISLSQQHPRYSCPEIVLMKLSKK